MDGLRPAKPAADRSFHFLLSGDGALTVGEWLSGDDLPREMWRLVGFDDPVWPEKLREWGYRYLAQAVPLPLADVRR